MPGNSSGAKRYCFTINGEQEELLELMNSIEWGCYGVCQLEEAPTTHQNHLQGFVVFSKRMTLHQLKKLHPTAHWEVMRGTIAQNETYCTKSESRVPGTLPRYWGENPGEQGRRSDLAEATEALMNASGGLQKRLREVAAVYPTAIVKYHKGMEALARLTAKPVEGRPPENWKQWQADLLIALDQEPDDRTILWYTDYRGCSGKSTVCRFVVGCGDATMLNGKVADMAYAYNDERIVFFDVTRTQLEHMDHLYAFAESLKNGMIFSSKYEAGMKMFKPPHVVFFANKTYDRGKWSADRVIETVLSADDAFNIPEPTP